MKRMITFVSAAGAAALMLLSTSARADHERDEGRFEQRYDQGRDGPGDGWRERRAEWREHEWRELQQRRRIFYARWDGNPWRRARFERWYRQRCAELRGSW